MKTGDHRGQCIVAAGFVETDEVAGLFGQLGAEGALYAAIAFAKRMRGAELSCPVVDVLKNVEVDGLQVGKVELAMNRMFRNFQQTDCRGIGLEGVQRVLSGKVSLVFRTSESA